MAESIAGAFSDLAASGGLLSAFKSVFHGNTRQMAAALGVSQRSVQYYATGQRKPSGATRAKMARHVPVRVEFRGTVIASGDSRKPDKRPRTIRFSMDAEQVQQVQDARNEAGRYEAFWQAYHFVPDDVQHAEYQLRPA